MTPERVELVGKLFEPYGNLEGYGPALELVEHVRELQAFVLAVSEALAAPGYPAVHAVARMQRQAEALRAKIQPPRHSRRAALSTWERVDDEHAGGPAPQCM